MASEQFIGQLRPFTEIPTDRPPELCIAFALYIDAVDSQNDDGVTMGDIAIHFAPMERLTHDSPAAMNQNPSNFDIWAALKAACDVISTYDEETRENIRRLAAQSKRNAFEQRVLEVEGSRLADDIRKANLAAEVRQNIINEQAAETIKIRKKLRRN